MGKKHKVIGYVWDHALPSIRTEDAVKLTHLNVAFGFVINDEIRVDHLKNLDQLVGLKKMNPALTLLLSVGGWGAGGFSEAASTLAGRKLMAESAVNIVKKYSFDGIDLDWEYPTYGTAGIQFAPSDKENFTYLVKEIREALNDLEKEMDHKYLLTIAAGADQYYIDGTEMSSVQQYLDYIQLMTYDMRGGFQTLTGHHTNLYTPTGDLFRISVQQSVNVFVQAGVPREKLVIGAAFYSRMWKDVPDNNNGLHQMTGGSGGYGPDYSELVESYVNVNGFTRFWDDEAKAPYLFDGSTFITYEDEESIQHKCEYVSNEGLGGIMFWEFTCDNTHQLLHTMHQSLE